MKPTKVYFTSLYTILLTTLTLSHGQSLRVSNRKCKEYTGEDRFTCTVPERDDATTENITTEHKRIPIIFGGKEALPQEFTHMAAIGWKNSNGSYRFDCGGSLISPKFVLTAAHCTYSPVADNPIPEVVKLGDHFVANTSHLINNIIQVKIKEIYKYPAYTHRKRYNDIALLELNDEVRFTINIKAACLWSSRDLSCFPEAIATGWGAIDAYSDKRPAVLQKVSLHLLSNERCNESLGYLISRRWNKGLIEFQLCAGESNGGKDTCQGDSGSPLQVPTFKHSRKYFVIGITSFGAKICGQEPAVYTRVSSYVEWIERIVWPEEYYT